MVSIVNAARDLGRLREISRVLVRHGFGELVTRLGLVRPRRGKEAAAPGGAGESWAPDPLDEDRGLRESRELGPYVRLRHVLEDLGPSFVKLGQIASTRADVLPPELIAELRLLQDGAPLVAFPKIKEQLEQCLGTEVEALFESFEETPLAAASIAQVHRAQLRTEAGPLDVVVKVQRPDISTVIASDLDLLHLLATLVDRTIPESRVYSPIGLVQQFDRAIRDELDFTLEADNALRFARNFEGFEGIRFPKIYREASGKRVITLEYFAGKKLDQAVADGVSPRRLARIALEATVKQIFDDGFFHADPHPGNVIVLGEASDPVLGLIDLGMVGRLSPRLRDLTVDLMVSALRNDFDALADALYSIGTPTRRVNMDAFRAEVALMTEKYLGKPLQEISLASLVRDLVRVGNTYGIEIPTDFLLVGKALMTVEGIGRQLDPELDVFSETRPLFLELLRRRYSPEKIGMQLLRRAERLGDATTHLPHQLKDVLEDLRMGHLKIRTEDAGAHRWADRLGRRLLTAVISGSAALGSALLVSHGERWLGLGMLAFGSVWLCGHLAWDTLRQFRGER